MAQDSDILQAVNSQILATIYGQCIGDALGLLTEFMSKEDALKAYGKNPKNLYFDQKVSDGFRDNWEVGDWTDDTDQMILILQSLLYNKGEIVQTDLGKRLKRWMKKGFPELGDERGYGLGRTTKAVLSHPEFESKPEMCAQYVWKTNLCQLAPNGGVMRTSIMGLHNNENEQAVIQGALNMCKVTHYDPRKNLKVQSADSPRTPHKTKLKVSKTPSYTTRKQALQNQECINERREKNKMSQQKRRKNMHPNTKKKELWMRRERYQCQKEVQLAAKEDCSKPS